MFFNVPMQFICFNFSHSFYQAVPFAALISFFFSSLCIKLEKGDRWLPNGNRPFSVYRTLRIKKGHGKKSRKFARHCWWTNFNVGIMEHRARMQHIDLEYKYSRDSTLHPTTADVPRKPYIGGESEAEFRTSGAKL